MTGSASDTAPKTDAIIVGAGIAGLAAALALAGKGYRVTLCERAEAFEEIGAGLQLSPNATRLLKRLGVLDTLVGRAVVVKSIRLLAAKSGRTLLNLSTAAKPQADAAPFLAVSRADLQGEMVAQVLDSPLIAIRAGLTFQTAIDAGKRVKAVFTQGEVPIQMEADVLIGADGVWSAVRTLVPGHAQTRHSGYTAWRATVPVKKGLPAALRNLCDQQSVGAFLSSGVHLVAYPLRRGTMLNLVLITLDMTVLADALGAFEPELARCLGAVENWRSWPLHSCSKDGAWTSGRIALIGDAAHAMTPFAAQGACMAIEDGVSLADCVSKGGDVAAALVTYEQLRKPRVAKVAARGMLNRFAYHASGPTALARNIFFALRGQGLMRQLDWLYRHDAGSV